VWVVVIMDANDKETAWRGPYEDQEAARKERRALAAEIDDLDDDGLRRFIAERGTRLSRRRARPASERDPGGLG
jgi:hypothetical protein